MPSWAGWRLQGSHKSSGLAVWGIGDAGHSAVAPVAAVGGGVGDAGDEC